MQIASLVEDGFGCWHWQHEKLDDRDLEVCSFNEDDDVLGTVACEQNIKIVIQNYWKPVESITWKIQYKNC